MAAARDLHRVRPPASAAGPGCTFLRAGRFTDGVGKRFQIVATGARGSRTVEEADDLPATRGGEALGVLGAQVITVGFGVGGERAEDRGRVGVDVRQRRDGGSAAGGSRTATYRAHDVGRYRTLERAATTLHQVTPPCRVVKRPTDHSSHTPLTCMNASPWDKEGHTVRSPHGTNTINCHEFVGLGEIRNRAQPWLEWSSCDMPCGAAGRWRGCCVGPGGRARRGLRCSSDGQPRTAPCRRPRAPSS